MPLKKVLKSFESDQGLSLENFKKQLKSSKVLLDDLSKLSLGEINLLVKLLIDAKDADSITSLFETLNSQKIVFDKNIFILALAELCSPETLTDNSKYSSFAQDVEKQTAYFLMPHINNFPEEVQKTIEASVHKRREENEVFREDLMDQIEFLKSQQLTEKALEIEEKLKFHFPEIKESFLSKEDALRQSAEQKFTKVLERNLIVEEPPEISKTSVEKIQSESKSKLELAEIWYEALKGQNLDLYLTQLEFMDFDSPKFYEKILHKEEVDPWTKLFLYIKSESHLEGLHFLSQNETSLLDDSPQNIYNFYYTKAVLLLGAGMNKEAEEILNIIKEQNENYRDVNLLLQRVK